MYYYLHIVKMEVVGAAQGPGLNAALERPESHLFAKPVLGPLGQSFVGGLLKGP